MAAPTIFKFGGTSLATADKLSQVADIITGREGPLVVVTSALGGVTDLLVSGWVGNADRQEISRHLRKLHLDLAKELELSLAARDEFSKHLDNTLGDLDSLPTECEPQHRDLALSVGERLATNLMAAILAGRGLKAVYIDSRPLVRTDSNWGQARVDLEATSELVNKRLRPLLAEDTVPVVTGFLGSNHQGETTTIGRNGSDLTATLLGACFGSREVWIWTDVDGIFTADPRYYEGARLLQEISYREAAEAAYFGASVIHPHTLWPLLESETAVRIVNTLHPTGRGTLICRHPKKRGTTLVTTAIEGVSVVTVGGYGMVGVPGIAATIFSAVQTVGASVLMISQSSAEHNISFVIRDQDVKKTVEALDRVLGDWIRLDHRIDRIKVMLNVSIVTVVGEDMKGRYGIAGKIFSALGEEQISVIAIAQGSSEYSISMALPSDQTRQAISAIHSRLDTGRDG